MSTPVEDTSVQGSPVESTPVQGGLVPEAAPDRQGKRRSRYLTGRSARRIAVVLGAALLVGLVVLALSKLDLSSVGHTLTSARPGWMALALVLMGLSLLLRAISWQETLRAAIPDPTVGWIAVARALVIGVMVSALVPGRAGEPSRSLIISRRLGSARRFFTVVLGTVFSQTLINLGALAILAVVTFTRVPIFQGREGGLIAVVAVPVAIVALAFGAPALLRRLARSPWPRLRRMASWMAEQVVLVRRGLTVFANPRRAIPAVSAQLAAWALQWLACYCVLLALGFTPRATLVTAAAILLAVNVSAILPATPSNVGVFQAACLVVLAAFGFRAGPSVAYGILLQAVEVVTALLMGIPALLGEGISWREFSRIGAPEPPGANGNDGTSGA